MDWVRRVFRYVAKGAVLLLAAYGLAWLVQTNRILESQCDARMWIVERDAMASENAGEWMSAAHGYAHLVTYGPATEWGCRSPELTDGAWQLPIWYPILRARMPNAPDTRNPDRWVFLYEENLRKAAEAWNAANQPAAAR